LTLDPVKKLEEENLEYRRVLEKEVSAHKRFRRVTLFKGLALLLGGIAVYYSYPPLAYLMILVGMLRVLNSVSDLQRAAALNRELRRLEEKFGITL